MTEYDHDFKPKRSPWGLWIVIMFIIIAVLYGMLLSCKKPTECFQCTTVVYRDGKYERGTSAQYCGDKEQIEQSLTWSAELGGGRSVHYIGTCY